MSTFLAEWGLAILIALAVLGVLIWAEWRDHRDGLYDEDDDPPDETYDPDDTTAGPYVSTGLNLGTDWRTVGPYTIDRDPADH